MDTTIRNIDEDAYRRLRLYATHYGLSVGEAFNRIMHDHVVLPNPERRKVSFWDLKPWDWGPGAENASERVDEIVYDEAQRL